MAQYNPETITYSSGKGTNKNLYLTQRLGQRNSVGRYMEPANNQDNVDPKSLFSLKSNRKRSVE